MVSAGDDYTQTKNNEIKYIHMQFIQDVYQMLFNAKIKFKCKILNRTKTINYNSSEPVQV